MSIFDKPDGPCDNCQQRPATHWWTGDGGELAISHGMCVPWCEVCVVEAQLQHARERAAAIPELERTLAILRGRDTL